MAEAKTRGVGVRQIEKHEDVNPLICGDGWNDDTAHNVRCALEFLADAIPLSIDNGMSKEMQHGCGVLIRTIATAVGVCHE